MKTFNEYQKAAQKTAIYPKQHALSYVALKLNGEAGEFAEHYGKALRDDDGILTIDRRQLMIKEIGDILWYLSAACDELGTSLDAVAEINIEKLQDRAKRDKLQGSGDER